MIISKRCFHPDNFCNTRNRRSFEKHFLLGIKNQFDDLFFLQSKSYCLSNFFGIGKILYDFLFWITPLFDFLFTFQWKNNSFLSIRNSTSFSQQKFRFLLFLFYLITRVQFSVFKFSIFPVKHFPISIQISHHLNLLKCFLDFRRLKVVLQFRYLYLVLVTSPWANCYRPLLSCCESDS